jgi:transcriptional repressor NrdR
MRCPYCGHMDTQVKDSRPTEDSSAIRRRRSCPQCGARFTTFERIQRMVNSIQRRLESMGESDIPSAVIGEMVMEALQGLDKVAYVRFASVYKNFREVKDFESFVETLTEPGTAEKD